MTSTVATPTESASATPVQRPSATPPPGWSVVSDAELAHLRALDEAVARLTAASRAAHSDLLTICPPRSPTRCPVEATPPRSISREVTYRRLELQVQALSDGGEAFRAARRGR